MDNVLTIAEERLNLFAHMANSACGLSLWCFGMKKQLYTCTCPAEKEFRLFLDLGQCLDYAIAHGPESHAPILMSDPIGMLWVAECVWHGDDASYLVILGPVFDAAASLQTLQNCLRGMNLSVSLTATIMEKLEQVPILPLSTLHQYIKMLHCNGVQGEHNKKLNNGLPILHKVPPKRDYGRYFCIMAEKGGTSHGGLTEKLSPFFHAKKQEVNAYGR